MRNDMRTRRFEDLQSINVVCVVMREHQHANGQRGDLGNFLLQTFSQFGRAQGIHHQHALGGDDKSGIGDEVVIAGRPHFRQALHVIGVLTDFLHTHLYRICRFLCQAGLAKQQRHPSQSEKPRQLSHRTPFGMSPRTYPRRKI